jgi:NAD(P)-dependent dehydrogenase (short-subunit alcohol dehydrogenase family)
MRRLRTITTPQFVQSKRIKLETYEDIDYEEYYRYMTDTDNEDQPSQTFTPEYSTPESPKPIIQTSELLNVPAEVICNILLYVRDNRDLFSFIITCKALFTEFERLNTESIENIRLWYLNGRDPTKRDVDSRIIKLFENRTLQESERCDHVVRAKEAFIESFHKTTHTLENSCIATQVLNAIFEINKKSEQQFVVAGGSIFNALNRIDPWKLSPYKAHDIDIFLLDYGRPIEESEILVRSLLEDLDNMSSTKYMISWFRTTINFHPKDYREPTIQFILHRRHSVEDLLCAFDLDCSRFAYDGEEVYTTREGIRALVNKKNFVASRHTDNCKYTDRVEKYEQRGYWTSFTTLHALDHLFPENYWAHTNFKYQPSKKLFDNNPDMIEDDHRGYPRQINVTYSEVHNLFKQGPEAYTGTMQIANRHKRTTVAKSFGALFTLNCSPLVLDHTYDYTLLEEFFVVRCYLCNKYRQMYSKEDCKDKSFGMCYDCDISNRAKNNITKNLKGQVAVVTGARVKLGFHVALKLLRAGATVIATTRFVTDARKRFKEEGDYDKWNANLHIYPLDLRNANAVLEFCSALAQKHPSINILINNAAQTVKRPLQFYKDVIIAEKENILSTEKALLYGFVTDDSNQAQMQAMVSLQSKSIDYTLSYLRKEDTEDKFFPGKGAVDIFGEAVDLRRKHSWNSKLEELSTEEIAEVQVINNVAPTLIVTKLLPLLTVKPFGRNVFTSSYIINVTSTEGQFVTNAKNHDHAHTNISKAALNMLTRSAASYYATKGIIMNSVDPGWVSSGLPTFKEPPLSVEDGASRILFPVFTNERAHGLLFKDYKVVPW